MKYYYYVSETKEKDGPHDLVTMMRRIRSGIVTPDTMVYNEYGEQVPAHDIQELSPFFNNPTQNLRSELESSFRISIPEFFSLGWNFISTNYDIMVFAGITIVLPVLLGLLLSVFLGNIAASAAGLMLFLILQAYFFAVSLRVYRAQKVDIDFIEKMLSPIVWKIFGLAIIFSAAIPLLGALLVVPGIIATFIFILASLIIYDNHYDIGKAISYAFSLSKKINPSSRMNLYFITFLYIVSIILIFPIPLMLPIFAGGICSVYEDLINL